MGHIYMILLVLACQTIVYNEVTALFSLSHKEPDNLSEEERRDPWSKTLNWYFFAVTNYFLYGETIIYYFKVSVVRKITLEILTSKQSISYIPELLSCHLQPIIDSSASLSTVSVGHQLSRTCRSF
jgi:hypothetical protein